MNDETVSTTEAPAVLVRTGPGGGKTAALLGRVREARAEGIPAARVLCLVLESAAVQGLERRLLEEAQPGEVVALPPVLTYEEAARQILAEAHGDLQGRFLDPLAERILVGRALRDTQERARYLRARELRDSVRFRDDVADFIAELKRHKLTPERFRKLVLPGLPDREALEDLAEVYERYQELLQRRGVFDLRGLLWLALMALEGNPALAASWRSRYALLLADDLQDATPLHLELLVALVGPQTELVGTCEPAQAVYRFRGAVGEPEPWLRRWLPGRRIREIAQTEAGALPAAVADVAERLAGTYSLNSRPAGRGSAAGEVTYALYRSWEEEKEGIGDAIVEALAAGNCAPEEVAVITRSDREAQAVAAHLVLRGIPTAGSAGPPEEWPARRLLQDVLTVLGTVQGTEEPAPGTGRARREAANQAFCRLASLIAAPEEQFLLLDLGQRPEDLLHAALPETCPAARRLQTQSAARRTEDTAQGLLSLGKALLSQAPPNLAAEIRGALMALLGQVADVNGQILRLGGEPLSPKETAAVIAGARAPRALPAPAVSVLTAHQSRGQRFRLVWVAGLQEESFPAPFVVSRLLSSSTASRLREKVRRVLSLPEGVLPFAGLGEAPSEAETEEQRLFYTCLTRSSERLVLSAHLEEAGAKVTPSPYLAAVLPPDFVLQGEQTADGARASDGTFSCVFEGLVPTDPQGRATHAGCPVRPCPRGESHLRPEPDRVKPAAADPQPVPVLREAAAGLVLYPSGLQEYLRCPRRFLLGTLLKVAPEEEADPATYGRAVHAFLREFNDRAPEQRTPEEAHRLLEAALAAAREEFSSPLVAELYARAGHSALNLYLQTELAGLPAIVSECHLHFTLTDDDRKSHRFGGKIDAAFEMADGVAVVDYKTGAIDGAKKLRERILQSTESGDTADEKATYKGPWEIQLPLYALAWKKQPGNPPVRRVCLQNFSVAHECKQSCVVLGRSESDSGTSTEVDLDTFEDRLKRWAKDIKEAKSFPGKAPEEGCRPFQGGCPFVNICDAAELI